MKRTIILSMAGLVLLAACQKENTPAQQETKTTVLSATVEQQTGDTKTALGSGNTVVWSEEDEVRVWNGKTNTNTPFTLTEGAGTTQGRFNGDEIENPQYAFYPSSAVTSLSGKIATFTLPAVQHYVENSFDNGANVAVAQISGNNMAFKNICGVLKIQLKGTTLVKTITITGNANEKLNGTYTVDASASTPDMTCTTTEVDSEKSVTLDCGVGVQLGPKSLTNFYFVVPKGAFANGFNITLTDVFSGVVQFNANANTINRSKILAMPGKSVYLRGTIIPGAFTRNAGGDKVYFMSGNLVATIDAAGKATAWKIHSSQLSMLEGNAAIPGTRAGDFDSFGFSGDGNSATAWGISSSTTNADYSGAEVSWGSNPSFQSVFGKGFRTMSNSDITYIVNNRNASTINGVANARYAPILTNTDTRSNLRCIALFPDEFTWNATTMGNAPTVFNTKDYPAYNTNVYTSNQIKAMEEAGVVFFPQYSVRLGGKTISYSDFCGSLRTTNNGRFRWGEIDAGCTICERREGMMVRLITDANK